jgi:hypothetical protein
MKKFLTSSSSSLSSSKEFEKDDQSDIESVTLKKRTLYDDSGQSVHGTIMDDAPDDEAASVRSNGSPKFGEVDRRKSIIMEEDVDNAWYTHGLASSFLEGCNFLTAAVSTP